MMDKVRRVAGKACLLTVVACLAACSSVPDVFQSFNKKAPKEGLGKVDDLLTRIEEVHVESVLSKERMQSALDALHLLVASDFSGNPAATHQGLVEAIRVSEKQAKALRDSVTPMKRSADIVFEQWTADLEDFTSEKLRRRSLNRLESTRERYQAIIAAIEPALAQYDAFNTGLRDHALFLGNDFNMQSVAMLDGEVRLLDANAAELHKKFDACLVAAQTYVRSRALRGQVEEEEGVEGSRGTSGAREQSTARAGN